MPDGIVFTRWRFADFFSFDLAADFRAAMRALIFESMGGRCFVADFSYEQPEQWPQSATFQVLHADLPARQSKMRRSLTMG